MQAGGYDIDILVQGYPGKTLRHGGLGWSTVALIRGRGHVAMLDTGSFGARGLLVEALRARGLKPGDVTDLLLSHLHYDHVVNWPMFGSARIVVGARELQWALGEPVGSLLVPELYVRPLASHPRLATVGEGDTALPGVTAHLAPGHTPGHLVFVVAGEPHDVILVQDAAKYRAELLSRRADMTQDPAASAASIDKIWSLWRKKPGSIVVPGHDLPMVLRDGSPEFIGRHEAGIAAILGDTIDARTIFDLAPR